jgi:hypothetical protein
MRFYEQILLAETEETGLASRNETALPIPVIVSRVGMLRAGVDSRPVACWLRVARPQKSQRSTASSQGAGRYDLHGWGFNDVGQAGDPGISRARVWTNVAHVFQVRGAGFQSRQKWAQQ